MQTVKQGRPVKLETAVEEVLMEIQAAAMSGLEATTDRQKQVEMFRRIVHTAFLGQNVVRTGVRTEDGHMNAYLLALMGEENLS